MPERLEFFTARYRTMYRAMIEKDGAALGKLLDDSFVLVHMTGRRQNKQAFISAVEKGTLNYFSEEFNFSSAHINGDSATFTGKSLVSAAVFGGARHTWHLQLDMKFKIKNGDWLICEAVASTWQERF